MVQEYIDSIKVTKEPCSSSSDVRDSLDGEKITPLLENCAGCRERITDRFLMRMMGVSWHEACLVCSVCRVQLSHTCYTREDKVLCRYDYERMYLVRCGGCGERIQSHELVMRAQTLTYHLQCFICVACCQLLQKGDQFVLRHGQLLCRADYEKELFLLQQTQPPPSALGGGGEGFWDPALTAGLDLDEDGGRPRDGRRGPKRPRTILTSAQRRQFKNSFEVSPKPCRKVREALAKETGLSVRVVQVWFQNQRAKMKKLQRRAKQQQDKDKTADGKHTSGSAAASSGTDRKTDTDFNAESPSASATPSGDHPFSPDGQSNDSMCASDDLSLDDATSFDNMDLATHTAETASNAVGMLPSSLSAAATTHQRSLELLHTYGTINPIDKLYLMQNSYFDR